MPTLPDPDEPLTYEEAARFLKVDRTTLWRWVKKGWVRKSTPPGVKAVRFRRAELVRAMEAAEAGGTEAPTARRGRLPAVPEYVT